MGIFRRADVWTAYRLEVFGDPYMVWHDGPSFELIQMRWDTDADAVDRMLRAGVEAQDALASDAIAVLAVETERASELAQVLEVAMPGASGNFRVSTAKALIALTGEQRWTDDIIDVLLHDSSPFVRLDAATSLAGVDASAPVINGLTLGVCDSDYLVRYHSANTLLALSRAGATIDRSDELIELIRGDARPESWREAAHILRDRFPPGNDGTA